MESKNTFGDTRKAILILGLFFGGQLLFQSGIADSILIKNVGADILNRYFNMCYYLFFFLFIVIMYKNSLKEQILSIPNNFDKNIGITACVLFFIIIGMVVMGIVLSRIDVISANQQAVDKSQMRYPLETFLTTVIFGPFVEEVIYRGIIFGKMRGNEEGKARKALAGIVCAFIFGAMHCDIREILFEGDYMQLIQSLPIYVLGLGMIIVYDKTRNIFYAILSHSIINLIAFQG